MVPNLSDKVLRELAKRIAKTLDDNNAYQDLHEINKALIKKTLNSTQPKHQSTQADHSFVLYNRLGKKLENTLIKYVKRQLIALQKSSDQKEKLTNLLNDCFIIRNNDAYAHEPKIIGERRASIEKYASKLIGPDYDDVFSTVKSAQDYRKKLLSELDNSDQLPSLDKKRDLLSKMGELGKLLEDHSGDRVYFQKKSSSTPLKLKTEQGFSEHIKALAKAFKDSHEKYEKDQSPENKRKLQKASDNFLRALVLPTKTISENIGRRLQKMIGSTDTTTVRDYKKTLALAMKVTESTPEKINSVFNQNKQSRSAFTAELKNVNPSSMSKGEPLSILKKQEEQALSQIQRIQSGEHNRIFYTGEDEVNVKKDDDAPGSFGRSH